MVDGLILDVGCGSHPNKYANVYVDMFPWDNAQRSGQRIKKFPKMFVAANVEALPFKDKAFDFSYCTHLMEHVERPEEALDELERVARGGYIAAPHLYYEFSFGKKFHRWFFFIKGGRVVMLEKNKRKGEYSPFGRVLRETLLKGTTYKKLRKAKLIESGQNWEGRLPYVVVYNDGTFYYN